VSKWMRLKTDKRKKWESWKNNYAQCEMKG
jgi:hypothetical protein